MTSEKLTRNLNLFRDKYVELLVSSALHSGWIQDLELIIHQWDFDLR